jgi:hypothetical protein
MMLGALVLAEGIVGMTEASAARRLSTPRTRSSAAWDFQIWGGAIAAPGALDLANFERRQAKFRLGFEFMYRSYGDPRTPEGRVLLAERSPIHKVDLTTHARACDILCHTPTGRIRTSPTGRVTAANRRAKGLDTRACANGPRAE